MNLVKSQIPLIMVYEIISRSIFDFVSRQSEFAFFGAVNFDCRTFYFIKFIGGLLMTREELKEQIDELMRQYAAGEIDGTTYSSKMMELTSSAQNDMDED